MDCSRWFLTRRSRNPDAMTGRRDTHNTTFKYTPGFENILSIAGYYKFLTQYNRMPNSTNGPCLHGFAGSFSNAYCSGR
jgi:23S rRNA maturation mini-RNase III